MKFTRALSLPIAGALLLAGIAVVSPASSSTPEPPRWESGQMVSADASSSDYVWLQTVDVSPAGMPVVAGDFTGTVFFPTGPAPDDSITVTAPYSQGSLLIAAMHDEGTYFTWATQVSGTGTKLPTAIEFLGASTATESDDTIMLVGHVDDTAYFPSGPNPDDSIVLPDAGGPTGFVAAIAPGRSYFAWVTQITTTFSAKVQSMAVRANGAVLITGVFRDSASFPTSTGSITLTSPSADSGFVAQLDAGGTEFAWAQRIEAPAPSLFSGASVVVSADDTPYVGGHFQGTVVLPTGPASDDSLVLSGDPAGLDLFIAELNTDDSYFAWAQVMGGPGTDHVVSLAVNPSGSPVVVGYFNQTVSFPRGSGDDSITLTSGGSSDIYVASMNADDSYFNWAVGVGGTGSDEPGRVHVTGDGELLIPGGFAGTVDFPSGSGTIELTAASNSGDLFLAQMNLDEQAFTWAQLGGTAASDYAFPTAANALADGRPIVVGYLYGTMNMVGADPAITLVSQANGSGLIGVLGLVVPPPDPPAPSPTPPSPPRDPVAVGGDRSATVTWSTPSSAGSYAISRYQVQATPGDSGCLVSAATRSCEVRGLANGTPYTFAVRALSGAGWSRWSSPTNSVTPMAPVQPTITIVGSRGEAQGARTIIVTGTTTGFDQGALLKPWVRLAGQREYVPAAKTISVSSSGEFTWQRRTAKKVTVYVASIDGAVRSNKVTIRR